MLSWGGIMFDRQSSGTDDRLVFIIDVSNVVHWRCRGTAPRTKLADLDLVIEALNARWPGCVVRSLADASLFHRIRETEPNEFQRYKSMLDSGRVVATPAGTKADTFVIQEADSLGGYMVTNDLYNKEGEKDLAPETVVPERFVRVHFVGDAVMLDTKGDLMPRASRTRVPLDASDRSRVHPPAPAALESGPSATFASPSHGQQSESPRNAGQFSPRGSAVSGAMRQKAQSKDALAILLALTVFVALAFFGSAGGWAVGIIAVLGGILALVSFFSRHGHDIVAGGKFAAAIWICILLLLWAYASGGPGGGLLLVLGLGLVYLLGSTVWRRITEDESSLAAVLSALVCLVLIWLMLPEWALPRNRPQDTATSAEHGRSPRVAPARGTGNSVKQVGRDHWVVAYDTFTRFDTAIRVPEGRVAYLSADGQADVGDGLVSPVGGNNSNTPAPELSSGYSYPVPGAVANALAVRMSSSGWRVVGGEGSVRGDGGTLILQINDDLSTRDNNGIWTVDVQVK
jgi:hypothetical protein